ncbi:16S rRNA (cytosine1402-N4)-methyltransferase [Breznakia sp. PF5-3]|uniref:16S rRNA (cytosine(1402)-N(4))-methyltransferase RsmH n=1 Tax=unclassified Breznakia TaxID=2623764 RepID=UPI002404D716|nr:MULTISPECIES: 16S rRNA (cytosine(1402)-N(4))-methyltransferase RsmH [unclassified Breznakia]MDF9824671.1 16S rRNA (cytosine1402-N4)-methyltransferase [Breznakia sp. PM6-1]MDF9835656.1 16S rRNA (cytosine1402-N4)-methyltransferase [Breznakia sp. PF5-3]MDF9837679.1 16S rRNA (cytosine1402-N4)-methyltransferase [Breznakia sp. PFB2-8]MDF9859543.1 16S rRNA (cytosine1402-N4)-methyltransferase [Breznakia sp. PH5-24]
MKHYPVMLDESIEALHIKSDGIYIDGTLGRAGHSTEILKCIPNGHLYAFDKDQKAIDESIQKLSTIGENYTVIHDGFENLQNALDKYEIHGIDGMLLDIGVSSPQFDDGERGFSYRYEAKLDMRMNQEQSLSAYEVVNTYSYEQLVYIISRYGEEKFAKQIARKIEQQRNIEPIRTTLQLVDVIKRALPAKVVNAKGHPAKKTFQALRIEVNNELGALKDVLDVAIKHLKVDGRLCVITFHSLEDRIVKEKFREYARPEKTDKRIPLMPNQVQTKDYEELYRKPMTASDEELAKNRRSHSAKLRVLRKVR